MKLTSYFVSALVTVFLFIGCKDAASKPPLSATNDATKKEVAAAVKPEVASFKIDGMVCPDGCAKMIEKKLSSVNGVQNAKVDYETKTATVNFDLDQLSSNDLVKTVETAGDGKTYKVSEVKTGNKI